MIEPASPTLRRRELGHRLRELRLAAGLTLDQVADHCGFSLAKASRMETGDRKVALNDLRVLFDLYGVPEAEHDHLLDLSRQSKERGWWQAYDVPHATYIGLEQVATRIHEYNPSLIPGLLQTPAYSRALSVGQLPGASDSEVDAYAEVKATRQGVLRRPDPPALHAIVDEAALHRVTGSPPVMIEQLTLLVESAHRTEATIQVLPFEAGPHPSLNSNFVLLHFNDIPEVVFVEGLHGSFYLEKESDTSRYREVFNQIRDQALTPERSVELISAIISRYAKDTGSQ